METDNMWTATFVEEADGEIRSFGNIGGFVYGSPKDAWLSCVSDFERVKKDYPNAQSYVNSNCSHIELWDDGEGIRFTWGIQRMTDFDDAAKPSEPCMKGENSGDRKKHYMVAYCWQYFNESRIDGIYGIFDSREEAADCEAENHTRALSVNGNTSCRIYEVPEDRVEFYRGKMAEHDKDGCREIYGYAPTRELPIGKELIWVRT